MKTLQLSLISLPLIMSLSGCAKRIQLRGGNLTINDRVVDVLKEKAGDVEAILKSDLPADKKTELVLKVYERRLEALKEVLLRESDKGKGAVAVIREIIQQAVSFWVGRASK